MLLLGLTNKIFEVGALYLSDFEKLFSNTINIIVSICQTWLCTLISNFFKYKYNQSFTVKLILIWDCGKFIGTPENYLI